MQLAALPYKAIAETTVNSVRGINYLICLNYYHQYTKKSFRFTPLLTVFQSHHIDSSHYFHVFAGFHQKATALRCLAQRHSHQKPRGTNVARTPRSPRLQVKHFTTEPCRAFEKWLTRDSSQTVSTEIIPTLIQ